jgi:hypothetical protein
MFWSQYLCTFHTPPNLKYTHNPHLYLNALYIIVHIEVAAILIFHYWIFRSCLFSVRGFFFTFYVFNHYWEMVCQVITLLKKKNLKVAYFTYVHLVVLHGIIFCRHSRHQDSTADAKRSVCCQQLFMNCNILPLVNKFLILMLWPTCAQHQHQ